MPKRKKANKVARNVKKDNSASKVTAEASETNETAEVNEDIPVSKRSTKGKQRGVKVTPKKKSTYLESVKIKDMADAEKYPDEAGKDRNQDPVLRKVDRILLGELCHLKGKDLKRRNLKQIKILRK